MERAALRNVIVDKSRNSNAQTVRKSSQGWKDCLAMRVTCLIPLSKMIEYRLKSCKSEMGRKNDEGNSVCLHFI